MADNPVRTYTLVLVANVEQQINVVGSVIGIHEAASEIFVGVDGSPNLKMAQGGVQRFVKPYHYVCIKSTVNQTVLIDLGTGDIDYGIHGTTLTASVTFDTPSSNSNSAHLSVPSGVATLVHGGHTKQQFIYIKSPITNTDTVFLGAAGIAANQGVGLDPGEGIEIRTRGAIYAYQASGAAQTLQFMACQEP